MKKNKMMRIASVLLVAVLLSTCAISGTFAKYTSTVTATSTATVAKWLVTLEGKKFNETITFDFTKTWKDSDGANDEENVVSKKLAPGTSGSFDLSVSNYSEVDARFYMTFDFSELEDIPLTYTYTMDGNTFDHGVNKWVNIDMNETKVITVNWVWAFENGDDAGDTDLGIAADTFDVSATLVMEQVD